MAGLVAGGLASFGTGRAANTSRAARPNILILMTDQQRFDALSCYGCRAVATPNLDRLARQGAMFERCYSPNPICTPTRASLLTGKHVPGHGVCKLHDILPKDEVLLPERLRAAGYETALVGKLHVSGLWEEAERRHIRDGFEHYLWCIDPGLNFDSAFNAYAKWVKQKDPVFYERLKREGKSLQHFPASLHYSTWAAEKTIERIRGRDSDRAFFILMSLFDPHDPYYDHPVEAAEEVKVAAIETVQEPPADASLPDGVRREYEKSRDILRNMPEYQNDVRALRKGYYASIAFLDMQIGRVLDCLDEQGLTNDTFVIFLSDHGDMLFDRGLFSKGAYFYDPSVRVPLLMRWPGCIPPGTRVNELVQHMDITSTVLAATGYTRDQLDGINPYSMDLLRLIEEGESYDRRRGWAVCAFRNSGYGPGGKYFDPPIHATMFHDSRYKLIVYHHLVGDETELEGELFDMQNDPKELSNLWQSADHADIKAVLLQRMLNWSINNETRLLGTRGGQKFHTSVMKGYSGQDK
jgi:arylsulfatase A-like enzyme